MLQGLASNRAAQRLLVGKRVFVTVVSDPDHPPLVFDAEGG